MSDFLQKSLTPLMEKMGQVSLKDLKQARQDLWQRYQTSRDPGFKNDKERLAYLLSRLPSTYSACSAVFDEFKYHIDAQYKSSLSTAITSVLDLGAGPGTATLACLEHGIGGVYTLIEQDKPMLDIAKTLLSQHTSSLTLLNKKLLEAELPQSDLVILSYVLGEMSVKEQMHVLKKAYLAANTFLIIISPGMSRFFNDFIIWRNFFIDAGAHILAPCPSHDLCPMDNTERWCHFKTRVQRTKEMIYLKEATFGFEDEPYSYLIITKEKTAIIPSKTYNRIIDHPKHKKGHSLFEVCAGDHLETLVSSSKDSTYKYKKKLNYGDRYPLD